MCECVRARAQANKDLNANILTSCEWDEQSISLLCTVLATFLEVINYFKINSFLKPQISLIAVLWVTWLHEQLRSSPTSRFLLLFANFY